MSGVPVLIISGTVGVGKTSLGWAASDILIERQVRHAFIDRDALTASWPRLGRFNTELAYRNLASVWRNFSEAGAERLIVSGVIELADDLDRVRAAVDGAAIQVCWVRAPQPIREARLRGRDQGKSLDWHLARTIELEMILETVQLHDFILWNEDRSMEDAATEMLHAANWIA
jgi:hypothetical protein